MKKCKEPVNPRRSAFRTASRRLILSLVHIRMEFEWFEPFEYLLQQVFRAAESVGDPAAYAKIAGGHGRVRTPGNHFSRYSALLAGLICVVGLGILAAPSKSQARIAATPRTALLGTLIHRCMRFRQRPRARLRPRMPDKLLLLPRRRPRRNPWSCPKVTASPLRPNICQMCHKLTNLTKAHKNLDDWKDTIHTMIDRGADIPDDKIDTLAQYLAKNFGPKDAAAAANAPAAAPATPAPAPDAAAPGTPAPAKAPSWNCPTATGKRSPRKIARPATSLRI